MREEYDLSKIKSRPNPYAKNLKREIPIDTDISVIEYFKEMAQKNGLSYQNPIKNWERLKNLYPVGSISSNVKTKHKK